MKGDSVGGAKPARWRVNEVGGRVAAALCTQPATNCHEGVRDGVFTSDPITLFLTADDFKTTESGNITSVCWSGGYIDFATETDCSAGAVDAFIIRYYTDSAGVPGTLIRSFAQAGGTLTVTGPSATGLILVDRVPEFEYTATHAAVPVVAGQTYWIEISNALAGCSWVWESGIGNGRCVQDGNAGTIDGYTAADVLTEDLGFCLNLPLEITPRPQNDNCADASAISGPTVVAFDTTTATTDGPRETSCFPSTSVAIDSDLWYRWTSTCTDTVFVRTCGLSAVDTILAVYNACPALPGEAIKCNDDLCGDPGVPRQSMVVFDAVTDQSYLIRVGRFRNEPRGPGSIEITCGPPPTATCPTVPTPALGACCDAANHPAGTPACEDPVCCATVCACDPFCCEMTWDRTCAEFGFQNSGCGALLLCGDRCDPCGEPTTGDCCLAHGGRGCADQACCDAVCACDSFCCDVEWDVNCATQNSRGCGANVQCAALCPPVVCPVGTVTFDDPQTGTVDARQPHEPDDPASRRGIDTIAISAPAGADRLSCWSLCETVVEGTPNAINAVDLNPGGGYLLRLTRPISANGLTAMTYTNDNAEKTTGQFIAHPSNVNAGAAAGVDDLTALHLVLVGPVTPPWGFYSGDVDRSGLTTPADFLRVIDLLGGGALFPVQLDTPLPAATPSCPPP